jgi:hypothetical protein
MVKYFCRKRCIEIDKAYVVCDKCLKNGFSGFANKDTCLYTNLIKLEDTNSDNN